MKWCEGSFSCLQISTCQSAIFTIFTNILNLILISYQLDQSPITIVKLH